MDAVTHLAPTVGVVAACDALGVARASFYRQRRSSGPPAVAGARAGFARERPAPLARSVRPNAPACCAVLHEERFQDRSPAAVQATLLDEGQYLCSTRTMYRILEQEGEIPRAPRSARASGLPKTRVAGHRAQPALELGHHQTAGSGQVDLLLSLRHPRRLQPLCRRLDGRASRKARNWPSSSSRKPSASTRFPPANSPSTPTAAGS